MRALWLVLVPSLLVAAIVVAWPRGASRNVAAPAAVPNERLFLATHACTRQSSNRRAVDDGTHDVLEVARGLALFECRAVLVPRSPLPKRVSITLSDAKGILETEDRIAAALRGVGMYLHHEDLAIFDDFDDTQPILDDDAERFLPSPGCDPKAPSPPWQLEGRVAVRAIAAQLAELRCTPIGLTRKMAERHILFGIDGATSDRKRLVQRVEDGLRAHGLYWQNSGALRLDTAPPPPRPVAPTPDPVAPTPDPVAPASEIPSAGLDSVGISDTDLDRGIHCEEARCRVSRKLRDHLLQDRSLSALASQARSAPALEGGKVVGVKVFAMRPGTVGARLGLLNGDVVLDLNGIAPDRFDEFIKEARKASAIKLAIKRRGQPLTIDFAFQQ